MTVLQRMLDTGVVAVMRKTTPETIIPIAKALRDGGVTSLEITVETPKVLTLIEKVKDELGDEVMVGAGTVLDAETARAALMAGASFIFSPTVREETIEMTKRYGAVSVAGAFTPTEILTAYEKGADMIKVFPASVVGPKFFKDIKGPLPHIPLMPTGGVDVDNTSDYIEAGAVAVGAGSTLVKQTDQITENYLTDLTNKAKEFVQAVEMGRNGE
ncbi:bifunctional 4-hydroxy-2-oxoglutarate aldolase/2-dehydro-3-deoxy-phosphogluconate aldolase [Gracilibacillus salitolerans]|uniref:Bifunctional 4-hydroxy-2-oxoglutarate aldolase/2-dehydro-3-deoxy-phosphogluconate aldolase n=1 Tax=Gracilibacillus salitolerans TaxID=2663022 RepID=A0A5Q2TIJ0_9BACI|nr:bifunctional 4-hydroxy-2-oxoglutarate aldolase/2-dehydro-3-deoxy-phosphogluconate aldolase [Gracilibacillus salitolerans]QGH33947.1 bifunctional 4-hydroxy-2-oxoglutarate aldolase/2-dehydro-3-deoxy-phosphogluconate aldolase [Gracilibacillus salitolerans]